MLIKIVSVLLEYFDIFLQHAIPESIRHNVSIIGRFL